MKNMYSSILYQIVQILLKIWNVLISRKAIISLNPHARTFGTTINETVQTVGY